MARITESSLMEEDVLTRYVFMMLLAIADPEGYVVGTDVAIARRINVSVAELKGALERLMAPDPSSNSREREGRRVIESDIERGYFLVNYRKYRDTRDEESRRKYMKDYMQNYRSGGVNHVNNRKQRKPPLAKVEVQVEAEVKEVAHVEEHTEDASRLVRVKFKAPSKEEAQFQAQKIGLPESEVDRFLNYYESNGWRVGKNPMKSWTHALTNWKVNWEEKRHGNTNDRNRYIAGSDSDSGKAERVLARQRAEAEAKARAEAAATRMGT